MRLVILAFLRSVVRNCGRRASTTCLQARSRSSCEICGPLRTSVKTYQPLAACSGALISPSLPAAQGATALFVPSNNGLPLQKADVVDDARNVDIARAIENSVSVVRSDVAGRTADLVSYGSSGIVDPDGKILQSAQRLSEDLLVADLDTVPSQCLPTIS